MKLCDNQTLREQILKKSIEISHAISAEYKIQEFTPEIDGLFDDLYDLVGEAFEPDED